MMTYSIVKMVLIFFQVEDIKEKIENAPDSGYQIGVVIGTYLPFAVLVVFAYIIYFRMKNRKNLDD